MRKILVLALVCLLVGATSSFAMGLGSTFAEIEREWGGGYREEFPFADTSRNVHIGKNRNIYISYITGNAGKCFGKPERAGTIQGTGTGVGDNTVPGFFRRVKTLLPADAKLIGTYKREDSYLSEIYQFKSASLARMKGIKDAVPYMSMMGLKGNPPGTFQLIVTYDVGSYSRIANFTAALGLDDHAGYKRMSKNPFK